MHLNMLRQHRNQPPFRRRGPMPGKMVPPLFEVNFFPPSNFRSFIANYSWCNQQPFQRFFTFSLVFSAAVRRGSVADMINDITFEVYLNVSKSQKNPFKYSKNIYTERGP